MGEFLRHKLPAIVDVDAMLREGRFVDDAGNAWTGRETYQPHTFVHFHRDLREEPEVPFALHILHEDERIVVVDKPHFLSTIPRGRHVMQSVVVKVRQMLDLPEAGPAHRLDRLTAGVLVVTKEARWRAPYQEMFAQRRAFKTYEAIAGFDPNLTFPLRLESHIRKEHGELGAFEVAGAPVNAVTDIHLAERRGAFARYRLEPSTGRTHQLRIHMNSLGLPLVNDPLYPKPRRTDIDDFTQPLALLAARLEFTDPVDGEPRVFTSTRTLEWPHDDGTQHTAVPEPASEVQPPTSPE